MKKNQGISKRISKIDKELYLLTKNFSLDDWGCIRTKEFTLGKDEIFSSDNSDQDKEYTYKEYLLLNVKEYLNEDVEIQ
jgi:hypothetical protein